MNHRGAGRVEGRMVGWVDGEGAGAPRPRPARFPVGPVVLALAVLWSAGLASTLAWQLGDLREDAEVHAAGRAAGLAAAAAALDGPQRAALARMLSGDTDHQRERRQAAGFHLVLWLVGLATLALGARWALARQRELEEADHALEAARAHHAEDARLEAVGQLAGGLARDVGGLLDPIVARALAGAEALPPGHAVREDLREIRLAAERARALIQRLDHFGPRPARRREPVDPGDLVEGIRLVLELVAGEKVRVQVDRGLDLPGVLVDRTELEIALINLAANARDAMAGGGTLTVRVAAVEGARVPGLGAGRFASLEVRDTGAGMDASTAGRAFEPFFTTKPPGRGTGLGLSTVRGIVRQHGGVVRLESHLGAGTAVQLLLPADPGQAVAPSA